MIKFLLFGVFFVIFSGFGLPSCDPLVKVLDKYGYTQMIPPNKVIAPGTILYFNEDDDADRGIACHAHETLGDKWESLLKEDHSMQIIQDLRNNSSMSLSADYLDLIKGDTSFKEVLGIHVQFMNPKVIFVSAATVLQQMPSRSDGCRRIVEELSAKKEDGNRKYKLFLVNSVLQGDVQYQLIYSNEANLSFEAKTKLLNNVNGKIKVGIVNSAENTIEGKDIYWGSVMNEMGVHFNGSPSATLTQPIKPTVGGFFNFNDNYVSEDEEGPTHISTFLKYGVLNTSELKDK